MKYVLIFVLLFTAVTATAQTDKVMHTGVGFTVTISFAAANHPKLGLAAGIGLGAAKELYDARTPRHCASVRDFAATAAGSTAAFVIWRYMLNRKPSRAFTAAGTTVVNKS